MEVLIGKSLINGPFSIAMFDYQAVEWNIFEAVKQSQFSSSSFDQWKHGSVKALIPFATFLTACLAVKCVAEELCNLHAKADQSSRTMERDAKVSSKKLDEASLNLAEVLS